MEKRGSLDKERYLFIYTKKKLELHSKMSIVYCLMGLEEGCKSTPNTLYTSNDVRAVDAGVGNVWRLMSFSFRWSTSSVISDPPTHCRCSPLAIFVRDSFNGGGFPDPKLKLMLNLPVFRVIEADLYHWFLHPLQWLVWKFCCLARSCS